MTTQRILVLISLLSAAACGGDNPEPVPEPRVPQDGASETPTPSPGERPSNPSSGASPADPDPIDEAPRYRLRVQRGGSGTGTIESEVPGCEMGCTTEVDEGVQLSFTARPSEDSVFTSWVGCDQASGTRCVVSVFSDTTVRAEFAQRVAVTVSRTGNGTGTVTGAGISCGADCDTSLSPGESVTLTAAADPGSYFDRWTGCASTAEDRCVVDSSGAALVTAHFGALRTLNVQADTSLGRVRGAGINCGADCSEQYFENEMVMLSAEAIGTAVFVEWRGCNASDGAECVVSMDSDTSVTAVFVRTFEVSVSLTLVSASGRIAAPGINCPNDCSGRYPEGSTLNLSVVPGFNSRVETVNGCDSFDATCNVIVNQNRTVFVTLVPVLVTETFTAVADNTVLTSSANASVANTVYSSGPLSVGCNWNYSPLTNTQLAVCAQALVRFDLSRLNGKRIHSATLRLTTDSVGVGSNRRDFQIRAQATPWSASSVTWNSFADDQYYLGSTVTLGAPTFAGQDYALNMLVHVQNWASGRWQNHGLSMGINNYSFPFATSFDIFEFDDSALSAGPTLEVTYEY